MLSILMERIRISVSSFTILEDQIVSLPLKSKPTLVFFSFATSMNSCCAKIVSNDNLWLKLKLTEHIFAMNTYK